MSRNYERLIKVVKQQVNQEERGAQYTKCTKEEYIEMYFWILAGIHQSALFILSLEEYYKFKEEAEAIEKPVREKVKKMHIAKEKQLTLF